MSDIREWSFITGKGGREIKEEGMKFFLHEKRGVEVFYSILQEGGIHFFLTRKAP